MALMGRGAQSQFRPCPIQRKGHEPFRDCLGKAGYSKERWQFWAQRFQEASNSAALSVSGKEAARRAAEMMRNVGDLDAMVKEGIENKKIWMEECCVCLCFAY
jgi:hypothetical protein